MSILLSTIRFAIFDWGNKVVFDPMWEGRVGLKLVEKVDQCWFLLSAFLLYVARIIRLCA